MLSINPYMLDFGTSREQWKEWVFPENMAQHFMQIFFSETANKQKKIEKSHMFVLAHFLLVHYGFRPCNNFIHIYLNVMLLTWNHAMTWTNNFLLSTVWVFFFFLLFQEGMNMHFSLPGPTTSRAIALKRCLCSNRRLAKQLHKSLAPPKC